MTKQEAFEVFKADGEMQPAKDMNTAEDIPTDFSIKNVIKANVICPCCGSRKIWKANFEPNPEWTYFCDKCKVKFIAVWEYTQ